MNNIFDSGDPSIFEIRTSAPGPSGQLPLTAEMLRRSPSGDIFGWIQNAGMGWNPAELGRPEMLILGTQGGVRAPDGTPARFGLPYGSLRDRAAGRSGGGRDQDSRSHSFRRVLQRPLRRPNTRGPRA